MNKKVREGADELKARKMKEKVVYKNSHLEWVCCIKALNKESVNCTKLKMKKVFSPIVNWSENKVEKGS